jgi:hypothetical protein
LIKQFTGLPSHLFLSHLAHKIFIKEKVDIIMRGIGLKTEGEW